MYPADPCHMALNLYFQKSRSPSKNTTEEERSRSTSKTSRPSYSKRRIADSSENDELAPSPANNVNESDADEIIHQSKSPKASRPPSGCPKRQQSPPEPKKATVLSDTSDEDSTDKPTPAEKPAPVDQPASDGSDMDLDVPDLPDLPPNNQPAHADMPVDPLPAIEQSKRPEPTPAPELPASSISTSKQGVPPSQQKPVVAPSAPSSSQSQAPSSQVRKSTMAVAMPERRKLGYGRPKASIPAKDRPSAASIVQSSPRPVEKPLSSSLNSSTAVTGQPAVSKIAPQANDTPQAAVKESANAQAHADRLKTQQTPVYQSETTEPPVSQAPVLQPTIAQPSIQPAPPTIQQGDKLKPIEIDEDDDDLGSSKEDTIESKPFISEEVSLRRKEKERKETEVRQQSISAANQVHSLNRSICTGLICSAF